MRSPVVRVGTLLSMVAVGALALGTSSRAALSVRVVDPSEILSRGSPIEGELDRLEFRSIDGYEVVLSLDGRALEISNPSFAGVFHPVPGELVSTAFAELALPPGAKLEAVLYCLPGLPVAQLKSFCVGREIFLAPSLAPAPVTR